MPAQKENMWCHVLKTSKALKGSSVYDDKELDGRISKRSHQEPWVEYPKLPVPHVDYHVRLRSFGEPTTQSLEILNPRRRGAAIAPAGTESQPISNLRRGNRTPLCTM